MPFQKGNTLAKKHGYIGGCGHRTANALPKTYTTWNYMKERCHRPNNVGYKHYGGRGIKICERWLDFENFLADMGEKPNGMSIERIDNAGDYCPENCRWATSKEQQNNKRNNRMITFNGKTKTLSQWADEIGMSLRCLHARFKRGWTVDEALTIPKRERNELREHMKTMLNHLQSHADTP